jgi:hypothetical protein
MQRLEQDSDAVVRGLAAQHRREEKEPVVVKPKKKRRAKA